MDRLKNITDSKSLKTISDFCQLSPEAKDLFEKIKKENNDNDPEKLVCEKTDNATVFNFNVFKTSLDHASGIYRNKTSLKDPESKQDDMKVSLKKLNHYNPENPNKIKKTEAAINAATELYNNRQKVIEALKTGIFPRIDGFQIEKEPEKPEKSENIKTCSKKFIEYTEKESKKINYHLSKEYFDFSLPSALAKKLYGIENKNKNNKLVKAIRNKWNNLKDVIKKMSENEKRTEQPEKVLEIVENVLDFSEKIQKQQGLGLKILTPNQILSRLPISLGQLKTGNNSEIPKNEVRQLLYYLYR